MAMSAEYITEMALINLAFAEAEIMASGVSSDPIIRALDHVRQAMSSLKRITPRFDYPFDIDDPQAAGAPAV